MSGSRLFRVYDVTLLKRAWEFVAEQCRIMDISPNTKEAHLAAQAVCEALHEIAKARK
jgi:hypothetical protein